MGFEGQLRRSPFNLTNIVILNVFQDPFRSLLYALIGMQIRGLCAQAPTLQSRMHNGS